MHQLLLSYGVLHYSDEEEIQDNKKDDFETLQCEGACCSPQREVPNQPTASPILAATKKTQQLQHTLCSARSESNWT